MRKARMRRHVEIVKEARPEIAVDSDDPADMHHMHQVGVILVRDADLPRVAAIIPGDVEASLIYGVTLYRPRDRNIEAVLKRIDRELGDGVATPDHALHITPAGLCPATEPEDVDLTPNPERNTNPASDGTDVFVSVVDTGFLPNLADDKHQWLKGVKGDEERYDPPLIRPFEGHGTFVAGIVRCLAPKADVHVEGFLTRGATIFESEIIRQLDQALNRAPDIISLSAGALTRHNLPPLSFEVFWENRLRHYKGTVLVAAAGNDQHRGPFWPAAFPWTIAVGAIDAEDQRARFTNYGSWVDVYAPGVDLVNAFPKGIYIDQEPPNEGTVHEFTHGMARWSGTSFSTPIVSGMIAQHMSETGKTARLAADTLLAEAREKSRPRVGAILKPT
jgi:hypothetical protein